MPTITRKIELRLCKEGLSEEEQQGQKKLLCHINDNLYKSANNMSSKLYLDEHVSSMVRLKNAEYQSVVKELGQARKRKDLNINAIAELEEKLKELQMAMSEQEKAICTYATEMATKTLAGKFASELDLNIYGQILSELKNVVFSNFEHDSKDVGSGKRSIRTYKTGMPIPFPWNDSIRLERVKRESSCNDKQQYEDEYDYYLKWYNGIRFRLFFGRDKSNNRQIVKRCMKWDELCTEDYQKCTSSIQMKKGQKGYDYYLLFVCKIPKAEHVLNKEIVVGVDVGINVPAYVATNQTEDRVAIGDREHFLKTRLAIHRRFQSFQRLKGTAEGRGRKKKLQPLERMRETERNWVHTQNHLFSRDVIKFALRVKAATIHMEDLSGYGRDAEGNVEENQKFFLGRWSYYELQTMIKYKAEKEGMVVRFINPAYTSQTCSWCGVKDSENRKGSSFVCHNPQCEHFGKEENADYNAARNIANSKNIVKE